MIVSPSVLEPAEAPPNDNLPPARFACGQIINVPYRVVESGIAKIVCIEDSSTNKYLRPGGGWHYQISECNQATGERKTFAEWIGVYESEMVEWERELAQGG